MLFGSFLFVGFRLTSMGLFIVFIQKILDQIWGEKGGTERRLMRIWKKQKESLLDWFVESKEENPFGRLCKMWGCSTTKTFIALDLSWDYFCFCIVQTLDWSFYASEIVDLSLFGSSSSYLISSKELLHRFLFHFGFLIDDRIIAFFII